MAERNQLVLPNEGGGAGEPPLVRARVESVPGPRWMLSSDVADVLLRGARPPDNVMLLSECLERVGCDERVANGNVRMDVVIQRPEWFIPDADLREMILSLPECQTYALVYRVVPLLRRKGITDLKQWGGADENTDAKRAVKDGLADDGLWNTTRGLLDSAFNAVKDAEARKKERIERERVRNAVNAAAEVIPGAFESVFEAKWSHVLSGEAGMPLGMRVVGGLPENFWSYADVNHSPLPLEVDREVPRSGNLEIMVLSSEDGWPYTQFRNETRSVDNNAEVGRGGVFNAQRSEDVYIRREVVRVWYIVEEQTRAWYIERKLVKPKSFVVVGTPGIGKSFACGSFLLYQLLHYKNKLLDVVAYFIRDSAYVIHNARPGVPGRVVKYSDQRAAVLKINWMAYRKRGFVIVDISEKGEVPSRELPTKFWPAVVLTSPDVNHYDSWVKDRGGIMVIVNCDDERDLVAFVAWRVLRGLPDKTEDNAGLWLDAEKILKEQLEVLDKRIQTVGPLPRFVLDDDKTFKQRETQVIAMLNGINENNRANYKGILSCKMNWQNDDVTHKLVKIMRVRFKTNGEDTF
ncbi:retrotransposon hot spot (RHS) protein, putative, partial [Trypanosoma vivax Y486]